MPCKCCRCAQTSAPAVFNLFDSLAISDLEENTLVLPSSRNHTLDNVLNQTTERMIDLIPVQKKRQFYGRSNASSAGLVAALRWTSTNDVDDSEATSIDQMKEAAQKAYQSINQSVYQSTSQAMNKHAQHASNQRNLQSSTATTLSNLSSSSSCPTILVSPEASFNQSHKRPSDQSNNQQSSHSNHHSQCPCACHHLHDSRSAKFDENSNTLNLPSNKSPSNQPSKHSQFHSNNQSTNQSANHSTLPSPSNSRPGTASRPSTSMLQSDTAIYRGGQSRMTEDELMDPPAKLDRALDELAQSVQKLSVDHSITQSNHQAIIPSSPSPSKRKKKKVSLSPVKKGLSDDQKAAALARRAVRQAEMDRKKREDAIKLAQVKADDKFYHEMMLKQYERRVKMQEFQRRHESQRAERLRQSNDSNLPSRSLSRSTNSFAPSRSFSHRFQPHSSASIVNEKPVFAEFGATNTRTKVKAHYMKTHNITPDLPPNQAREPQSYSQARRTAINQLYQREAAIARLGSSFRVEASARDHKIEQMARSFPPPVFSQSHPSNNQSNDQSQMYRVVRHPYPSVNSDQMSNSMNQSIATVANDPIRMYQHQAEA